VRRKKVPRRKVRKVKERIEKSNNSGVSTFLMLESREALAAKTQEAVSVLRALSVKEKSEEIKN